MVIKKYINGNGWNECDKEETLENVEREEFFAWIPFCYVETKYEWKKV